MEKSSQNFSTTSVIFKTLPKVNNPPLGENLPILVTLGDRLEADFSNTRERAHCLDQFWSAAHTYACMHMYIYVPVCLHGYVRMYAYVFTIRKNNLYSKSMLCH
jgi:hypothetical protein